MLPCVHTYGIQNIPSYLYFGGHSSVDYVNEWPLGGGGGGGGGMVQLGKTTIT